MKLKNILHAILFLTFSFGAIIAFARMSESKAMPVFTEDQLQISVDSKQSGFIIKLKSNPTTGYSWNLKQIDSSLLASTQHQFVAAKTKLMGAPGFEEWTFRVLPAAFGKKRHTTLTFVYARPWEKEPKNTKTLVFGVEIR